MSIRDLRLKIDPYEPEQMIGTILVPFVGIECEFTVVLEPGATDITIRQADTINAILALNDAFSSMMDDAAFRYYKACDGDPDVIVDRTNVRENCTGHWIVVPPLHEHEGNCFFINCGCTWETEHGMTIGVRNNEIVLCEANNGIRTVTELDYHLNRRSL